jgi:hypothetical protein
MRLVLCLCLFPWSVFAQSALQKENLKDSWLINREGKFVKAPTASANSVFFWIDGKERGNFLRVKGRHAYAIFINSKLVVRSTGEVKLSVDSLANIYSLLLQTNPTLTFDYLDVNKLFSFQDRDESTLALRIASSVNLLVYLFCSLFLALILLVSFHSMGDQVLIASQFTVRSTMQGFQQWIFLSAMIFGLLILKLIWLVILTSLFGFRDIVRIQFFNFVRVVLIAMSFLTLITIVYFVANVRDQRYFFHLITILSIIFSMGVVVMYFKLVARMPYHFFHLFSYLCASEIMPLVVLIKVFFY